MPAHDLKREGQSVRTHKLYGWRHEFMQRTLRTSGGQLQTFRAAGANWSDWFLKNANINHPKTLGGNGACWWWLWGGQLRPDLQVLQKKQCWRAFQILVACPTPETRLFTQNVFLLEAGERKLQTREVPAAWASCTDPVSTMCTSKIFPLW